MKNKYRQKLILLDVDGTLTTGEAWTEEECLKAKPRKDIIAKTNKLYDEGIILIWTARKEELMPATLIWLRKHGVKFHGWATGKKPAGVYIDDKAVRPEEL